MNHRHAPILLPLLIVLTTMSGVPAHGENAPRLVVNILVDQLRSDYLNAFMPLYGHDGFRRLLQEGRVYVQAEAASIGADRASTAASVATGTTPADHGIVGQRWMDRATLRPIDCTADGTPAYLGVSTIGDEAKVATEGKSLVYAIAPFRDAAVLTAGHAADAAMWIDDETGLWSTSAYYGPLPPWAVVRNGAGSLPARLDGVTWRPVNNQVGSFSYFLGGGAEKPFAHKFALPDAYRRFKTSGLVNEEVAEMAVGCVNYTTVGDDALPDYLAVTFYAGSYDHQPANAVPIELQDTYVRLDDAIARLVRAVEHKVGLERALFVLTSTGSNEEETDDLKRFRIPSGTFDMKRSAALLNMYLVALYGQGQYVDGCFGTQIYLNHKLIEQKQLNLSDVLARSQDFLQQLEGVRDVYTSKRLLQGAWTPGISRIRAGYNPRYSGDVMVEVAPGWRYVNSDTNENTLVRASFVPFPILFYGYALPHDTVETPVTVDYIAPTLSKAMRIRAPNACDKAPLF